MSGSESRPTRIGAADDDPRDNWGPGEWYDEVRRLEAEVERLREEIAAIPDDGGPVTPPRAPRIVKRDPASIDWEQ